MYDDDMEENIPDDSAACAIMFSQDASANQVGELSLGTPSDLHISDV